MPADTFVSEKAAKATHIEFAPPGEPEPPTAREVSVPLKNDRVGGQAMKALVLAATAALAVADALSSRRMRGCGEAAASAAGGAVPAGGGVYHTGDAGGFEHGTAVGPGGVAHEGDAGGYWHGSAANGYGAAHASAYGGYYHGTYA